MKGLSSKYLRLIMASGSVALIGMFFNKHDLDSQTRVASLFLGMFVAIVVGLFWYKEYFIKK